MTVGEGTLITMEPSERARTELLRAHVRKELLCCRRAQLPASICEIVLVRCAASGCGGSILRVGVVAAAATNTRCSRRSIGRSSGKALRQKGRYALAAVQHIFMCAGGGSVHLYICIGACVRACIHVRWRWLLVYVSAYGCVRWRWLLVFVHVYKCMCAGAGCLCIRACVYVYVHWRWLLMCVHACIYIC